MAEADFNTRVANLLNDEFGDDVRSLRKAKDVADKLVDTIKTLENKICVTINDDTSTPACTLAQILQSAEKALKSSSSALQQYPDLSSQTEKHTSQVNARVTELQPSIEQIEELEKYLMYLKWIQRILNLSFKINDAVAEASYHKATRHYVTLVDMFYCVKDSLCCHLRKFIDDTVQEWHGILLCIFDREFREILELMKWPFIIAGNIVAPTHDVLSRFENTFALLQDIDVPDTGASLDLPLQLLFRPFRNRFLYHFMGNKKTNCVNKPEWCFTQVLSWIRTNAAYLDMYIQPILNRPGSRNANAKTEFVTFLCHLVTEKLKLDIESSLQDEPTLAHIINETVMFEKELRNYVSSAKTYSVLSVLVEKNCFSKWLQLEKELAIENMDRMFSTNRMWKPLGQDQNDSDTNKIPECCETFVTMILSITDRYKNLHNDLHRLPFFNLQMELVDDLRIRLLQLLRTEANEPLTSNLCAILNGVYYIMTVLKDWSDLPFFLQLQNYKVSRHALRNTTSRSYDVDREETKSTQQSPATSCDGNIYSAHNSTTEVEDTSNLDTLASLFEHIKDEMLTTVTDHVVMEFKAKSYNYRHEKWFSLPPLKDFVTPSLSPTACGMFVILTSSLKCLRDALVLPLFNRVWQAIAERLSDFFYEEVILLNRFNEGGAAQLNYDMTRNLFPVFAEHTRRPENHFKKIKESCILLTLSVGSAMLLHEALSANGDRPEAQDENPEKALEEIGVYRLSIQNALNVLKLRTDMNCYL